MVDAPGPPLSLLDTLRGAPVVGILRRVPTSQALAAASAAVDGGLRAVEITMDGEDAEPQISSLRERFGPEVLVGAGTVTTLERFRRSMACGAQFIVSPSFDPQIVDMARDAGLPVVPGALTPTEVLAAWRGGATVVKLYPVGPLGPGYVRTLLEPLSEIPVMCNGLVTTDEAPEFLRAGGVAVGMGGTLFTDLDPTGVRERTKALLEALEGAVRLTG